MTLSNKNFDSYTFSKQPGFNESAVRQEFAKAAPLRTVVVYCYDPRVIGIPEAVAREFGEVHPGDIITDAQGNKVATTTTLFEVVVAGGRAVDSLRSITVAQHLFGIENIVIVHHTNCGASSFTTDGIIDAFKHEHGADISDIYDRGSVSISDYTESLKHDIRLVRDSKGTPPDADIFGYMYDTDTDTNELYRVAEDIASNRHIQSQLRSA